MNGLVRNLTEYAKDFIFPDGIYCICCGNIIDQSRTYSLCDHCMTHIHWNLDPPRKVVVSNDSIKMIKCADYGIYERSIIFALKYDAHTYISRIIAKIMKDRLIKEFEGVQPGLDKDPAFRGLSNWLIVPVPLHKSRLAERGYNHAELIAKHLSREIRLPMMDMLERRKETRPMKGLGPAERDANIRGSIRVKPSFMRYFKEYNRNGPLIDAPETNILTNISNSVSKSISTNTTTNVLLIDDFYTTGSTAKECARALRNAGIRGEIWMLAFAAR